MDKPDPRRLAQVPLFQGLSENDLVTLASWLDVDEFPAGRMPLREADSGYAFFVLDEGRVHAEHDGQILEVLGPGAVFGEMAFFSSDGRRAASIVSETPIRVFTMFGTRFRVMQRDMPEVAARLQHLFQERLARLHPTGDGA
ncbi:MAG TPA: cyclic nucleotide-binding domain-containing protein [Acidimicrobiales bacterium]|jgi:CRP/FNR family transcriptional regulator|nr:cyclic nucleotide-binding domain-containing protein [Acidimicrobiales bacterium]